MTLYKVTIAISDFTGVAFAGTFEVQARNAVEAVTKIAQKAKVVDE